MSNESPNRSSFTQIEELGNMFNIPVASDSQQVWFLRTSGGDYYDDFRFNNYVAIGWDKIPAEWIIKKVLFSSTKSDEENGDNKLLLPLSERDFKKRVSEMYPDEKRPGLVYGQLNTFYNGMRVGDWIVIPSKSTQDLTIGILGDVLYEDIKKRKVISENQYVYCRYIHKRSVIWKQKLPTNYDIYLQKSLRAQQTISNITEISSLVLRHLYPVYVVNNEVRITFQKTSEEELNVLNNIELISSIVDIANQIADLYKIEPFSKGFTMKTAVGSPGIIELIIPLKSSAPVILGAVILLLGKYDSEKGISTGLASIFNMVNKHLNDKKARQLKDAEIREKEADIKLKNAEVAKLQAETERIRAENELLKKSNQTFILKTNRDGQMVFDAIAPFPLAELTEPSEIEVKECIIPIAASCMKCAEAAKANGIRTGEKK